MLKLQFRNSTKWYDIDFVYHTDHVVEIKGYIGSNTSGFYIYQDDLLIGDYLSYTTIYKSDEDSTWFSNDGSHYVPPTSNVTVGIRWMDDEERQARPDSLQLFVMRNHELLEVLELPEDDSWTHTYEDVPATDVYEVSCKEVDHYEQSINGTMITYTYIYPTLEERVDALEERADVDEEFIGSTFATVDELVTEIIPEIIGD